MKDNETRNGFRKPAKKQTEPRKPDPIAELLLNIIKDQVQEFITLTVEERVEGAADLYNIGSYSPTLESDDHPEEAAKYAVYQLERAVRVRKDDPANLSRLSTAIILINKETGLPAYYLTSYITPKLVASVRVVPFNEKGPWYRDSISWDSRDSERKAEADEQ